MNNTGPNCYRWFGLFLAVVGVLANNNSGAPDPVAQSKTYPAVTKSQ